MDSGYLVRDYNVDDIRDAERLVRMYATFDSAWPGGFMRGVNPTAEYMFEAMRRSQRLAVCVVQHGDEMVGYCDLHAQTGNSDLAYIPLLGADPSHHGQGVGKALLLEMIRRVTALGFRELTLHTWGGNLKAVPLYKKTGFNWEPETSVHMRNFIPGILNSAPGREFFGDKDWYECFDREIVVEPDEVTWNGMRVFPYTFRSGDRFLKATIEMASGGMTALETNDYSVDCCIPTTEGEAPAGETLPITWRVSPKSGGQLEVILLTETDDGLSLHVREHMTITAETEIRRDLIVLPTADPRHEGERERCVRSTLILNGTPVLLETGVQVVRPISISYNGQGLHPGRPERVVVKLQSNLDRDVSGTLSLDAHPALNGAGVSREFTLPARLAAQCEFEVTGTEPGVCLSTLRFEAGTFRGTRPVTFRTFGSIAPAASIDLEYDEEMIIESPGTKITQELRGGALRIKNRSAGHSLKLAMPEPGPPFASMRRAALKISGRIEQTSGGVTAVLRAEYPEFPGLVVERSVVQLAGDLVRIDFNVNNTTAAAIPIKLRVGLSGGQSNYLVLPVGGGIIREPRRDWDPFPLGGQDVLDTPESLTENWIAEESGRNVSGVIWNGKAQLEMDWRTGLTLDAGEVGAYSNVTLPAMYAVAGSGTWEVVRGWWRKLVQSPQIKEKRHPEAKRVLSVRTSQSPLLLTADITETALIVENNRKQALSAEITLEASGLTVTPDACSVSALNRSNSATIPISVTELSGLGAGVIRAKLTGEANTRTFKLPVIRVAGQGTVRVTAEKIDRYRVTNGVLSYTVVPGFLGSIVSLEADGVNHLHSSWPKPGTFVWANPWYGGIHPYLDWIGDEQLPREKFTGGPIERVGETGLRWQGVGISCRPVHRDLRWLDIGVAYLTLPGSDLLALVYRFRNLSGAEQYTDAGVAIWAAAGGDRGCAVAHWSEGGELRHRRRGMPAMDVVDTRWAAVENEASGHRMQIVAPEHDARAFIDDMSDEGAHLGVGGRIRLEPGETIEKIAWLIMNPAISEFDTYSELKMVQNLP